MGRGQANFDMNKIKTIRHELGHSMGLNNDGTPYNTADPEWADAQVSGWVPSTFLWLTYSPHHVVHINPWF